MGVSYFAKITYLDASGNTVKVKRVWSWSKTTIPAYATSFKIEIYSEYQLEYDDGQDYGSSDSDEEDEENEDSDDENDDQETKNDSEAENKN